MFLIIGVRVTRQVVELFLHISSQTKVLVNLSVYLPIVTISALAGSHFGLLLGLVTGLFGGEFGLDLFSDFPDISLADTYGGRCKRPERLHCCG